MKSNRSSKKETKTPIMAFDSEKVEVPDESPRITNESLNESDL